MSIKTRKIIPWVVTYQRSKRERKIISLGCFSLHKASGDTYDFSQWKETKQEGRDDSPRKSEANIINCSNFADCVLLCKQFREVPVENGRQKEIISRWLKRVRKKGGKKGKEKKRKVKFFGASLSLSLSLSLSAAGVIPRSRQVCLDRSLSFISRQRRECTQRRAKKQECIYVSSSCLKRSCGYQRYL